VTNVTEGCQKGCDRNFWHFWHLATLRFLKNMALTAEGGVAIEG
jgi:hypothetical protein